MLLDFSNEKCLAPFDSDGDGKLSRGEFSELCYKLFVGTGDEVNYGVYDFDPDAIFSRITADDDAGRIPHRWPESREGVVDRSAGRKSFKGRSIAPRP